MASLLGRSVRGCHASVLLSLRAFSDNPCWASLQVVGLPTCGHACMRSSSLAPGISNLHYRGLPVC